MVDAERVPVAVALGNAVPLAVPRVARALKPPSSTTTTSHRRLSLSGAEPARVVFTQAAASSAAASEPRRVAASSTSVGDDGVHAPGRPPPSDDGERRLRDARAAVLALRRSLAVDAGSGGGGGGEGGGAPEDGALDNDGRCYAEQLLDDFGGGLDVGAIDLKLLPQAPLELREAQAEALLQRGCLDADAALGRRHTSLEAAAGLARAELERQRSLLDGEACQLQRELELRHAGLQAELRRMFAAAERRLRAAIAWQRARVWQRFGGLAPASVSAPAYDPLLHDDGESAIPRGAGAHKELRVRWDGLPQPVQVRLLVLRGVRDRVPSGAYTMHAAFFDRLGGRPLRWSQLPPHGAAFDDDTDHDDDARGLLTRGATPLPVRHSASFSDVELPFHQPMRVLLPPRSHLHPGMVVVLRLYRTATRSAPLDTVCGWAALPACDADSCVAVGRFRVPLLRGDVDPTVASFAAFEERAADRSAWLCNAYVAVTRLSREATIATAESPASAAPQQRQHSITLREFDVKLALSSSTLRLRRPLGGPAAESLAALAGVHVSGGTVATGATGAVVDDAGERWRPTDGLLDSDDDDDGDGANDGGDAIALLGGGRTSPEPAVPPAPAALLCADAWRRRATDARRLLAAEAQLMAAGQGLSMSLDALLEPRSSGMPTGAAPLLGRMVDGDVARALASDGSLVLPPGGLCYLPPPPLLHRRGAPLPPPPARHNFSYYAAGGHTPRGCPASSATVARPRALTALRRKCRLLRLELFDGFCLAPAERAGVGARAAALLTSAPCWAQLLTLAAAFYARAFARVGGQYLLLRALRVPVYQFALAPAGATLRYVAAAVPAHIELGVVAAAPLSALLLWLALAAGLRCVQRAFGPTALTGAAAAPLCWFVLHLGALTACDGPLTALTDALAGRYDCADRFPACAADPAGGGCPCFDGDAWRLARRFALDEGSPSVGIAVAAALYALTCALALAALWWYLSHVHLGGRIQDTYRRLVAPPSGGRGGRGGLRGAAAAVAAHPEDVWMPADDEVSLEELQRVLLQRADAAGAVAAACVVRLLHRREAAAGSCALGAPATLSPQPPPSSLSTLRGLGGDGLVTATHVLQLAVVEAAAAEGSRGAVVAGVVCHFVVDHRTGAVTAV